MFKKINSEQLVQEIKDRLGLSVYSEDGVRSVVASHNPGVTVKPGDKIVVRSAKDNVTWRRVVSRESYGRDLPEGYVPYVASNSCRYRAKFRRCTLKDGTPVVGFDG